MMPSAEEVGCQPKPRRKEFPNICRHMFDNTFWSEVMHRVWQDKVEEKEVDRNI